MGGLVLTPVTVLAVLSRPLVPVASAGYVVLQVLAWVTFVAGAGLRFWAMLYVGGRKEQELVTDGPYSLCRNPLYLGSLLLGVSAALLLQSPMVLGALLLLAVLYTHSTVSVEEQVLRARHGARYAHYALAVPRYWPRRLKPQSPPEITVDVHRLWLECGRASRWIWLPVAGTALNYLRTLPSWPALFRFF